MTRLPAFAAVAAAAFAAALLAAPVLAQPGTKHVAKASPRHTPRATQPPAPEPAQALSAAQLAIAAHVLTGRADCEFKQSVEVEPVPGQPGYFSVSFAKARYTMVPQETTTGAVRLLDPKAGVMWLQIPVKSMLMNSKLGQRMVDACTMNQQRITAAATPPVASTLAP